MQMPGASAHQGIPVCRAASLCAQYKVVPQLTWFGSPRPMNWRPDENKIAYSALVRKLTTISEVIVGMISTTITYSLRSPRTLAASRKSRFRSVSAWDLSCLAVYDQLVTVIEMIITQMLSPCA